MINDELFLSYLIFTTDDSIIGYNTLIKIYRSCSRVERIRGGFLLGGDVAEEGFQVA
jgi:hypothetical protein